MWKEGICHHALPMVSIPWCGLGPGRGVSKTCSLTSKGRGLLEMKIDIGQGNVSPGNRALGTQFSPLWDAAWTPLLSSNCFPWPRPRCGSSWDCTNLEHLGTGKCARGWRPTYHFSRLHFSSFQGLTNSKDDQANAFPAGTCSKATDQTRICLVPYN